MTRVQVQRPGETKSGDNDALKHLLSILPEYVIFDTSLQTLITTACIVITIAKFSDTKIPCREEFARKVGVAPQCCFNSYWWRVSE